VKNQEVRVSIKLADAIEAEVGNSRVRVGLISVLGIGLVLISFSFSYSNFRDSFELGFSFRSVFRFEFHVKAMQF